MSLEFELTVKDPDDIELCQFSRKHELIQSGIQNHFNLFMGSN